MSYWGLLNHKNNSPTLISVLTQTIEAFQNRNRSKKNTQKEKADNDDSDEHNKKLQFPFFVPTQYEHHIASDMSIYNTTVHKNQTVTNECTCIFFTLISLFNQRE